MFVQTVTAGNSVGDSTFLTNGRPQTGLVVPQVRNPGGTAGNPQQPRRRRLVRQGQQAVGHLQEDQAGMTTGTSFNVMVRNKPSGGASTVQVATTANTNGEQYRAMLLFTGPVEALRDAPALAWYGSAAGVGQEPHLVWPEDQAWCLACEVDEEVEFTVGYSEEASQALARALPGAVRRVRYGEPAPMYRDLA
jgi:hypothetical protein